MDNALEKLPEEYLTKTEIFVLECRQRGMSDTAIRRLLQLSAADAVALGLIPAQNAQPEQGPQAQDAQPGESWPQSAGRRKPFARSTARGRREGRRRG